MLAEPTFSLGLALQLPFAIAAYAVAALLLRAARSIARLIVEPDAFVPPQAHRPGPSSSPPCSGPPFPRSEAGREGRVRRPDDRSIAIDLPASLPDDTYTVAFSGRCAAVGGRRTTPGRSENASQPAAGQRFASEPYRVSIDSTSAMRT